MRYKMKYFQVKNFEKYQHYHTRNITSWVKIYFSMFDDYDFTQLNWEQKYCYIALIILAAKINNKIPNDMKYLSEKIGNNERINENIVKLIEYRFLVEHIDNQDSIDSHTQIREDKIRKDKKDKIYKVKPKKNRISLFNHLLRKYPNKVKQKDARGHFNATVNTKKDWENINKALSNYLQHLTKESWKRPQNCSTWFNNWRDWVDYKEPGTVTEDEKQRQRDALERAGNRIFNKGTV